MTPSRWDNAIREPLVHFLIAGAALFLIMSRFGADDSSDRSIIIDKAQVTRLATQWQQTWRRPPTQQELDSLIRDHIKEEIYYREAIRLGLDVDDPIIRRRLRTKMEFLATAQVENEGPTDAELKRFHDANRPRYIAGGSFSFEQRFFADDETAARKAIVALNAGQPVSTPSTGIPASMKAVDADQIASAFGNDFARDLVRLKRDEWDGPVRSGFGWHTVKIQDAGVSKNPLFADVRQQVANDWRAETRASREAAAYQTLLDGYDIRIATP
jgi:peptidyl-prolyl cis-trans isomerase C